MATTANHVLLRRITLSTSASSITFDSIPQTGYSDLKIMVSARSTYATNGDLGYIYFNGVGTNQTVRRLQSDGSSVTSNTYSTIYFGAAGASDTANTFCNAEIYVPGYTSTTNHKSVSIDSINENNATTAYQRLFAGLWSSNSAITSVTLYPNNGNWDAGSSFALYGIANAATTPALAPKADGGDIIKTDGTYWYHAFLASGTFKPQVNINADCLVIAGGGAGGGSTNDAGGGGGAGGYRLISGVSLSSTATHIATVGSGGAGIANSRGASGTNSSLIGGSVSISSTGGGGGGGTVNINGASGGSGGGGGSGVPGLKGTGNAGGYSPVEGYDGANAYGGGGGAAAAATNETGGSGSNSASSWASATGTGVSGYYAGGGTSGVGSGSSNGGGGRGESPVNAGNAAAGTVNTGSGGGATWTTGSNATGKSGGSGIIIIRYPV